MLPTDHHHSSSLVANASQTARKASAESAVSHEREQEWLLQIGRCRRDNDHVVASLGFREKARTRFWQRRRDSFTIRTRGGSEVEEGSELEEAQRLRRFRGSEEVAQDPEDGPSESGGECSDCSKGCFPPASVLVANLYGIRLRIQTPSKDDWARSRWLWSLSGRASLSRARAAVSLSLSWAHTSLP